MRAIIRCQTLEPQEAFLRLIKEIHWWPADNQKEDAELHKTEILRLVASKDKDLIEKTYWFMIYRHKMGQTWGLVSRPQDDILEIRLKNESPSVLCYATEKLIEEIQNSRTGMEYSFQDIIEVLEPNSQQHAFYGRPLPTRRGKKWALARKERSLELRAAIFLFVIAGILIILSTPPAMALFFGHLTPNWFDWTKGFIERVATSAIISGFLPLFGVFHHYQNLKAMGAVRWETANYEF